MGATQTDTMYRVLEPFSFDLNGRTYVMRKGDVVTGENPAYRGRHNLFEAVTADVVRASEARSSVSAVETATAGPGERRRMDYDPALNNGDPDASVPPGPSPPAPTGEPAPPAPTPPPAPTGEQPAPSGRGRGTRVLKDQPQA